MKFKPIKKLTKIICAVIISIFIALPASSIKPATNDQSVISQINVNNNLSKSIIRQVYNLLNSSEITKNLAKPDLFSAKSSLNDLRCSLENLSISEMKTAQEIFNKLSVLRHYVLNKATSKNILELTENLNETVKYIKNIPPPTRHTPVPPGQNKKEPAKKMPPSQNNKNINKITKPTNKALPANKKAKNTQKKPTPNIQNANFKIQNRPNPSNNIKAPATSPPSAAPSKTILAARAGEASKIKVIPDAKLKETWEKRVQAGIQGKNDCWLFSAINVQNWFNFKNNQKIIRGQAQAHNEFLKKGEPKHLLGHSQSQTVIARYLQKCGFNTYIVLSSLKERDPESLSFNKSLAEILIKKHFLKSQTPIIIHTSNHWFAIAGINTASNEVLVVDSAFIAPFWRPLSSFYDSIVGAPCFFKSTPCYSLGMIFVTRENKADNPKTISILQSKVNSPNANDILMVNQFLTSAIDAASR